MEMCNIVGYSQADAPSASTAWGFNLISHTKCNVINNKEQFSTKPCQRYMTNEAL